MKNQKRDEDPDNFDKRIENCKRLLLADESVLGENKKHILDYDRHNAANQVSIPTRIKYICSLRNFGQYAKHDFTTLDKRGIQAVWGDVVDSKRFSPEWLHNQAKTIKTFWRFLKEVDEPKIFPQEIRWLQPKKPKLEPVDVSTLINEADIKTLIDAAPNPRDKAFLSVLWDGGLRSREIRLLKLKDCEWMEDCVFLNVRTSKAALRKVLVFMFHSQLRNWVLQHPRKNNPEAFVFCSLSCGHEHDALTDTAGEKIARTAFKRCDLQGKKQNLHHFRHSSISYWMQKQDFTQTELSMRFWGVPNSNMMRRYVHLNDYLTADRITGKNGTSKEAPKTSKCPGCGKANDGLTTVCVCGKILRFSAVKHQELMMSYVFREFMQSCLKDEKKAAILNQLSAAGA